MKGVLQGGGAGAGARHQPRCVRLSLPATLRCAGRGVWPLRGRGERRGSTTGRRWREGAHPNILVESQDQSLTPRRSSLATRSGSSKRSEMLAAVFHAFPRRHSSFHARVISPGRSSISTWSSALACARSLGALPCAEDRAPRRECRPRSACEGQNDPVWARSRERRSHPEPHPAGCLR